MTSLVIDVRPARLADAGALADVHAGAWREAYSGIIPALTLERMIVRRAAPWWRDILRRRAVLVLEVGGEVAGYLTFAPASFPARPRGPAPIALRPEAARQAALAAAEIQEIYLAPEYQGLGFGTRLLGAALKVIRGKGYGRAVLRAIADNDRAVRFYERRGGRLFARSEESLGGKKLDCLWFEFPV